MNVGRRRFIGACTCVCVCTCAGVRAQAPPTPPQGPQKRAWPAGRATPPLELARLEGGSFRLAEAQGEVVLLNFWASWCEPCRAEMPALEAFARRLAKDRVQVLAVNYRDAVDVVKRCAANWPIGLPIARDAEGAAARAFDVRAFPSTVAIARDGRAVFVVTGEVDWHGREAQDWVGALL